jgi:segregation and condensation protein B
MGRKPESTTSVQERDEAAGVEPMEPAVASDGLMQDPGADKTNDDSSLVTAKECAGFAESEVTIESVVESLLFSTDVPLSAGRIAQLLEVGDAGDVKRHIESLNEKYERTGAAFRIEGIAKGYQLLSLPVYNRWIGKLHKARSDARLSQAALETLAVIAYKQPVLRADIEAIRGVACGDMLVRLREMNLVRIVGRAEEIGRPLLYGTTSKFLDVFGLSALKDLPKLDPDKPNEWPQLKVAQTNSAGQD